MSVPRPDDSWQQGVFDTLKAGGIRQIAYVPDAGHAAAIRAAAAFLDVPGVSLQWEPVRADIAASGDLGWTTGRFVSEGPGPDGTTARAEGIYVSIWRLQSDGTWKVATDMFNADGAATPVEE